MCETLIDMLARLGVLILLFEVGLESTVGQMLEAGSRKVKKFTCPVTASIMVDLIRMRVRIWTEIEEVGHNGQAGEGHVQAHLQTLLAQARNTAWRSRSSHFAVVVP